MGLPSKALLSVEAIRTVYEYGLSCILNVPLQFISPKGDGHPIMIIPGLGTGDGATYFLRNFLKSIGYEPYSWGFGRNMGPKPNLNDFIDSMLRRVKEISAQNNHSEVSIIGHSLGGIYGREIAKYSPHLIRQVITLASPFKDLVDTNATFIYEILNKDKSHRNIDIAKKISEPPPVPFTSLYTKTDGVVNWHATLENEGPFAENVEVPGASHMGLSHNPIAMYIIADRLSKNKENWTPYKNKNRV
jgi:alpha-beta hydrolase superfamily lysophospholipase